jgi:ABC-type lipoprotein export system ATPase subunit
MITPSVDVRDVFCLYPTPKGHVAALRGLTLHVDAGERVVVHGPNGAGKTSLLRLIAGDQPASAGQVQVCGVDLLGASAGDRDRLRSTRIGMVEQRHGRSLRPELSVVDNVALQLRMAGASARSARRQARQALSDLGLTVLAGRRGDQLSGGEAQRVAVCAAIAHHPSLLLADEPTGELDRGSAEAVYALLRTASETTGAALVLVSHDIQAAQVADRVVRIRDGRLSEQWSPGDADRETLVVDDRGWVRLPEPLRRAAGIDGGVRASGSVDRIVLDRAGAPVAALSDPVLVAAANPAPGAAIASAAEVTIDRADRRVLDRVSIAVPAAALTVVQGRSGSGKTTLLRLLCGLDRPDSGRVDVLGRSLAGLDRAALAHLRRDALALAGQDQAVITELDVISNLELVRRIRNLPPDPIRVANSMAALGLTPLAHRRTQVLSGGEQQRVAVARVLVAEPRLAVFDEPTSQQDEANAQRIVAALLTLARSGAAVITASHDPVLINAADQLVSLG